MAFADSRGLALATVHVYNECEDEALSELLTEIEGAASGLHLADIKGDGGGLILKQISNL